MTAQELLIACKARDIWLTPADDDRLNSDAPPGVLTAELVDTLKAHKSELLDLLRGPTVPDQPKAKAVCRCGSTTWQDFPIHRGQSVRRDCGRCGRFLDFPVWYGKPNCVARTVRFHGPA